jgi:hypothetical protein
MIEMIENVSSTPGEVDCNPETLSRTQQTALPSFTSQEEP